jgi:hypothetical protein
MATLGFVAVLVSARAAAGHTRAMARQSRPHPVVLILHGRGMLGRDTAALRLAWSRSLQQGAVALTGASPIENDDVRLVWYADVLDASSDAGCDYPVGDPRVKRVDAASEAGSLLANLGVALGALSAMLDDQGGESPFRAVAGELSYVSDLRKRCAVEQRLTASLERARAEKRPVILIAHSFGSLVAYDHLSALAHEDRDSPIVERLVTVGAMIGAPEIRQLLFGEAAGDSLRVPGGVRTWVNIRNPADPLAVALSRSPAMAASIARVRDVETTASSDSPDAHDILAYLRDPATVRAVLESLCAAREDSRCQPAKRQSR